jgi:hypothetical protein
VVSQKHNWAAIASELQATCPSPSLRAETSGILAALELLGPLREPVSEFRRVYTSLQWNEPSRIRRVVEILQRRAGGSGSQLHIRADAWGYTVAAYDEWISHGRIFYLVVGILESALRTRIHSRMTDYHGTEDWPNVPGALPSSFAERTSEVANVREKQWSAARRVVAEWTHSGGGSGATPTATKPLADLAAIFAPLPEPTFPSGDIFLRSTTLYDLTHFIKGRRYWNDPLLLQDQFRGRDGTAAPPPYTQAVAVVEALHRARNEMAHYRPGGDLSFAGAFFHSAQLSNWLGVDLQHVYGSIDSRGSTELSRLLDPLVVPQAQWHREYDGARCKMPACVTYPPLDWLLDAAPGSHEDVGGMKATRACAYHRVLMREEYHRPRHAASH